MNRILEIKNIEEARQELGKIGVSSQGVNAMAPKAISLIIKLENVRVGAANILKQEMLSIGGDAAVARGVVNGVTDNSEVILLGNADKIKKLIRKLDNQTIFNLPQIQSDLKKLLNSQIKPEFKKIKIQGKEIELKPLKIMGILNVTPDSFSDGKRFLQPKKAIDHALQMAEDGADIIDIGGESSRPGARAITAAEEIDRVIPIISQLSKKLEIPISIDTTKADVARKAIKNGASLLNDISALRFDEKNMVSLLQDFPDIPIILMHMQGTPRNMQKEPYYDDVLKEIILFFQERIAFCERNGIDQKRIIIDPGIGFGKRHQDNLTILHKLAEMSCLQRPIMLGASRKSFIGRIYQSTPEERLVGSLSTTALAMQKKIEFVRVHDVLEHREMIRTLSTIEEMK